jgi:uncharacterized protein DUF3604
MRRREFIRQAGAIIAASHAPIAGGAQAPDLSHIEGLPVFDGGFTDATGVRGRLGHLGSEAEIGLLEAPPNAEYGPTYLKMRRETRHRAIVVITRGARSGLTPINAPHFTEPFGPPVLQVSSEEGAWLKEQAGRDAEATLVAHVKRAKAQALNVTARLAGADPELAPLVVMTPRSGWGHCASERGGGLVCWLEAMRALAAAKPQRGIWFLASSGHELGHVGLEAFMGRRPDLVKTARVWIHFGANIGAAQEPSHRLQASSGEFEQIAIAAMNAEGTKVSLDGRPVGEINVPAGKYTGRLDGVKIAREGGYKFEVVSADRRFRCVSNPVLVERNPQQRIYWGEFHGHSDDEEGYGTVPRYYEYARDVAFLDFASLTGHDLFLSQVGWEKIRRETESANRPGQFVAYMGYEWTQPFRFGGHHNVFFKTDKGRYVTRWEAPRPNQLYEKLRAIDAVDNVLVIPHAHEPGDWNFNDAELERLVEIFSMHGSFEYFGKRYLRRGYRTGFVAASDDHTGHPGYSPAVISTRNGLAAVYSAKLDRDGIWNGMKRRATYATSNATRPVVKMTVGDKQMGEAAPAGTPPIITARVLGTAPIDHIDVIHNGQVVYRKEYLTPRPNDPSAVQIMFHTPSETPGDEVASPRGGVGWGGWIEVSGGRIASIEPLNADHHTDEFHQVDDRRIWFTCRTRGDFDGLLIRLAAAPADSLVKVIISDLTGSAGGTGASGYVARPPGPPGRKAIHEINFKVSEVAERQAEFKPAPNVYVYARKARANAPWDVSFSYRPTGPPAQDDYFYLRVTQIDGEVAWVSPVWIGEWNSAKKSR